MKKIVICLFLIGSSLVCQQSFSQEKDIVKSEIEILKESKEKVISEEKAALKKKVIEINKKTENGEIMVDEAKKLKSKAAALHALNIENKVAIIENSIALLNRKSTTEKEEEDTDYGFSIGLMGENSGLNLNNKRSRYKNDIRTYSDLVIAFGLNNAIIKGQSLDDSPYKIGGSRFFEIGWAWNTRILNNSNALRFKYGFSFQYNGFKPTDNMYFVEDGELTVLAEFPENLTKSKFRSTNLVFPIHLEFGPSRKIKSEHRFRYSTNNKFKFGIGGYAGFNLSNLQKLKYKKDGDRVKEKSRKDFNTNNFVYGLSAYIGKDDTSLYVKYDISTIFKSPNVDQNNISVGVRFDL